MGGVDTSAAEPALAAARDSGCEHLAQIADEQATAMDLPREMVLGYLRDNLHFELGEDERRGLALFFERAEQLGLVAKRPEQPETMGATPK